MKKKICFIACLSVLLMAQSFTVAECANIENASKSGKQVTAKLKANASVFFDKLLNFGDDKKSDAKISIEAQADPQEILPKYRYLPEDQDILLKYKEAESCFYKGLNATEIDERKASLAKGIELISEVYSADKDAVCSMFLAAKLYRAYGGLGYAKMYYEKAMSACASALVEDMECRQAHLDLAIMNIAGDARFYKDYNVYEHKAEMHAEEVLKQIKALKNPDGRAYYQAAMANFILKNNAEAQKSLRKALDSGYVTDEYYKNVCQEIIDGKFKVYPVNDNFKRFEFISYGFGRIAN